MLSEEFNRIIEYLRKKNIKFVLTGALASSIWGVVRATANVDIIIPTRPNSRKIIANYGRERGLSTVSESQNQITLRNEDTLVDIDFILCDYSHCREIFRNAKVKKVLDRRIKVISPEDLIITKLFRLTVNRGEYKDKEDIAIISSVNRLNLKYLCRNIKKYQLNIPLKGVLAYMREKGYPTGLARLSKCL